MPSPTTHEMRSNQAKTYELSYEIRKPAHGLEPPLATHMIPQTPINRDLSHLKPKFLNLGGVIAITHTSNDYLTIVAQARRKGASSPKHQNRRDVVVRCDTDVNRVMGAGG